MKKKYQDSGGQLGRRADPAARAEGMHRICERTTVRAVAATQLAAPLEPLRVF